MNTAILDLVQKLHESLQELMGLHQQLWESVRAENEALIQADSKGTFEAAASKEALIHWIGQAEFARREITTALAPALGITDLTLKKTIFWLEENRYPEPAKKLQTDLNALIVLIERIQKQNQNNAVLVEASLKNVTNMRKNLFGEDSNPGSSTYNQSGQTQKSGVNTAPPRMISREV